MAQSKRKAVTAGERLFLLTIAATVGGLLLSGFAVYSYSWEVMRFPMIAGAATILLCVFALLRPGSRESAKSPGEEIAGLTANAVLRFVRRIAVAAPLVLVFGYVAGLSLYLFYHLRRNGESWRLAGLLGLLCFLFIQLVFVVALERPFAGGLLGLML